MGETSDKGKEEYTHKNELEYVLLSVPLCCRLWSSGI